jgi:cyclopropane fatty-acyl-phospholipid synthase-like methyltransferase
MAARYAEGNLPWDAELPPPEVIELAERLPPGRALDLGCGFGRATVYLAARGWTVDAVDFIPAAVAETRRRSAAAGVVQRVTVHQAAIPELDFLSGPYDLVLDVGCGHGLAGEDLVAYRDQLRRLLTPGGTIGLFTRLRAASDKIPEPGEGPRGLVEAELLALFAGGFIVRELVHGESGPEGKRWPSAWVEMRASSAG